MLKFADHRINSLRRNSIANNFKRVRRKKRKNDFNEKYNRKSKLLELKGINKRRSNPTIDGNIKWNNGKQNKI